MSDTNPVETPRPGKNLAEYTFKVWEPNLTPTVSDFDKWLSTDTPIPDLGEPYDPSELPEEPQTIWFKLHYEPGEPTVAVVNPRDGSIISNIAGITADGLLRRWRNVNPILGFDLDEYGRVKLENEP